MNLKIKRKIYLGFTMLLGLELAIILQVLLESLYVSSILNTGTQPVRYGILFFFSYLPPWVTAIILLAGIVGGFFLGQTWWRIVYIEKRHWRFRKKADKPHN
jgi:NADH:ubiquinone oxidoreductase subunit 6 (subunit J)